MIKSAERSAVWGLWLWFFDTRRPLVQAKLGARFFART